ncbi:hypothetical protein N9423_02490 [Alphaproteobacteria bacterium]|nr:hypothetical protein [Alphaproteobacteria bacterium]
MLKLGIRVSSSSSSGRGHFERCLAIRKHIKQKVFWFLDGESQYIKNKVFKLDKLYYENGKNTYESLKKSIINNHVNCVLVDSYHINSKEIYKISNKIPIMVIIDKNITTKADIVICPQPIKEPNVHGIKYLYGPKFAPISDKFIYKKNKTILKNKILISFGSYDSRGITLKAIKAVINLIQDKSYSANIVITLSEESPIINQAEGLIKNFSNFKLVLGSKNMQDIYKYCNLAIGAPGLSYLERLASGLPSLLIPQNKAHEKLIDKWVKLGCGLRSDNTIKSIEKNLKLLLFNDTLRKEIIKIGKNLVDGKGASRIANEINNMEKKV